MLKMVESNVIQEDVHGETYCSGVASTSEMQQH